MADQIIFVNPSTGAYQVYSGSTTPSLVSAGNGRRGLPQVDEHMLQLSGTNPRTTADNTSILSKQSLEHVYQNLVYGGEFVPAYELQGKEARLSADIAIDAVSMTVEASTTVIRGVTENIFVASRPYLLMNRKPEVGENIFETGVGSDGLLKPAAEIIIIDSGYSSGTTLTISRPDGNAAARKKGAVLMEIPSLPPSFGATAQQGFLIELERPDAVTMGTCIDGGTQTIDVRFLASDQQADTPNDDGDYGVVTYYSVFCLKKTGPYAYAVHGVPEHCPASQYDDTGQVDAIVAIDGAKLTSETIDSVDYVEIEGINRYWDPADCALKAIVAGDYWIGVAAQNQSAYDPNLRRSHISFTSVTVA